MLEFMKNTAPVADTAALKRQLVKKVNLLESSVELYGVGGWNPPEILQAVRCDRLFLGAREITCETCFDGALTRMRFHFAFTQGHRVQRCILNPGLSHALTKQDREVLCEVRRVAGEIVKPGMSACQKEQAAHDYLVQTSRYDVEHYRAGNVPPESSSPYGILLEHAGVCEGYAQTFQLFMTLFGVANCLVAGQAGAVSGGAWEAHVWNMVKLDNEYYHVDVTFDNPVGSLPGTVRHRYFNVTDAFLRRDHVWEEDQYPACSAVKYACPSGA